MRTNITARHCEVSDELRSRTLAVVERLAGQVTRPVDATVVFDVAAQASTVEIRLLGSRGEQFIASGEDRDHRSALDRAEEKIRKQLEKAGAAAKRGRGAKGAV
jgi:ribosomal subunit interface protein